MGVSTGCVWLPAAPGLSRAPKPRSRGAGATRLGERDGAVSCLLCPSSCSNHRWPFA